MSHAPDVWQGRRRMKPIDKSHVIKLLRDYGNYLQIKGESFFKSR